MDRLQDSDHDIKSSASSATSVSRKSHHQLLFLNNCSHTAWIFFSFKKQIASKVSFWKQLKTKLFEKASNIINHLNYIDASDSQRKLDFSDRESRQLTNIFRLDYRLDVTNLVIGLCHCHGRLVLLWTSFSFLYL